MARKKITELPLDNAVIGTDVVPIVSDGATKRVQLSTLGTYFASVGGGQPSSHAASHAADGSDPITVSASQMSGGSLPNGVSLIFSDGTNDSEVGGWGFGVELTADATQYATIEPTAIGVYSATGNARLLSQSVAFSNGTSLAVGTFDIAAGGYSGISLNCAVGYELNWQAGHLKCTADGGATATAILCDSPIEFPGDGVANVAIDAVGITFADGSQQTVACTGQSFDQSLNSTDSPTFSELTLSGSKLHSPGGYVSLVVPQTVTDVPLISVDLKDAGGTPVGSVLVGVRSDAGAFVQSAVGPVRIEQSGGGLGQVLCSELAFESGSVQTTAWLGSVDVADVTGLGDLATQSSIGNITSDGRIGTAEGVVVTAPGGLVTVQPIPIGPEFVQGAGALWDSDGAVLLVYDGTVNWYGSSGYPDAFRQSINAASATQYATSSVAGVVKIGSGISIDAGGVISASAGYTLPQATASTLGGVIVGTGLSVASGTVSVSYGSSSGTSCQGNDSRLSDARTPTSHVHGNITNAGAIGTTSGLPIITTTSGVLTAGAFGSSAGQFCQGNDSRLSDTRTPTAHKASHATGGSDELTAADIGAAATSHSHAGSDITSGTIATARLGSGSASSSTFLRGDNTWASAVSYATTTQARELNSAAVAMNPARLLDSLINWAQVLPSVAASTTGGGTSVNTMNCFADSGSTSGGTTSVYTSSNGALTNLMSAQSRSVDWTVRRYFCVRVRREATASSSGFGRFYYGYFSVSASGSQPTQRAVGFELRGTAPRLWVIAHNGTTLTQTDSGWDVTGGSDNTNEFLVEATGGTVNVYVDGVLRGTATGGPTTTNTDTNVGINYQVGNGGVAARTAYFISAARFTI